MSGAKTVTTPGAPLRSAPGDALAQVAPIAPVAPVPLPANLVARTASADRPLVWLDLNEGPPPAEPVQRAIAAAAGDALRRYPDVPATERRFAERLGLDPAQVLLTYGGDDAIDRICRIALAPGRRLVRHDPTFMMIDAAARRTGADVRAVPWWDGPFPIEAFLAGADANANANADDGGDPAESLFAIVSPNNPTGRRVPIETIERIADARPNALVLMDAAYGEFDADDLGRGLTGADARLRRLLTRPNIVVVRTFSKAWGLAGLRLGWAAGSPAVIDRLRAMGGPFDVSGPALAALDAIVDQRLEPCATAMAAIADAHSALRTRLLACGADCPDGTANFVTGRWSSPADAASLVAALADAGFMVRSFDGPMAGVVRITCPTDPAVTAAVGATIDRWRAERPSANSPDARTGDDR